MKDENFSKTVEIIMPLSEMASILNPENVKLKFISHGIVNIGILCYLSRSFTSHGISKIWNFDPNSFDQERAHRISKLILFLSEELSLGLKRHITTFKITTDFIYFINWCDSNNYSTVLKDASHARMAFRGYTEYLLTKVNQHSLNINTAARYQRSIQATLMGYFEDDQFKEGAKLIRRDNYATNSTSPPTESSQAHVLSLCRAIFDGLSQLVLEKKLFPYKLAMPEYLNWSANYLWVFPTARWYLLPHKIIERHKLKDPYWAYDYLNGRVAHLDEIASHYAKPLFAKQAIQTAKRHIREANNDFHHRRRRDAAMFAFNTFIQLFVANTGMNWTQVGDLKWGKDFEISSSRQGFRAIKYRANNKGVSFEIQTVFLPLFKKFIELRTYLLNGADCDSLFFGYGNNLTHFSTPIKLPKNGLAKTYEQLEFIDPTLPRLMTRKWRAAKSDYLIRNTDISTAAMVLQNNETTFRNSYMQGSSHLSTEEMTSYFESLSNVVMPDEKTKDALINGPVGACISFGSPRQACVISTVSPDCVQPEGCLFCDKYRVHADETDVRKLLSCKKCIHLTAHLSETEEQFQNLFGSIVNRIDEIVGEISKRNLDLVMKVKAEVEEFGELDKYWEGKLNMLVYLEII